MHIQRAKQRADAYVTAPEMVKQVLLEIGEHQAEYAASHPETYRHV
jgi:hypothetical protein